MRQLTLTLAMASAGLLAACGGSPSDNGGTTGGGGGGGGTGITLTGVVAKGAALAGAEVEAKCASGTATTTTAADGSYTITITTGALPCVLEATGTGTDAGLVLHSVATGTGSVTANITPLTELLVAQLSGEDPAAYMASVAAGALASQITTTTVGAAQTAVIGTLAAAGLDTTALGNIVSGALVAANGSTTGNGYDLVLDALAAALATAGTTLGQLTETVALNSPVNPTPDTPNEAASPLPANLLMSAKASNCDALRSTTYRLIKLTTSSVVDDTSPFTALETVRFDAPTLTATFADDSTMVFVANGNCRYTLPEGDAVVSPAGVMVLRHMVGSDDDSVGAGDRGGYRMMVGLPVQHLEVSSLAGTWNFLGVDRDPTVIPSSGLLTVNASGTITSDLCFGDPIGTPAASCTPSTDPAPTVTSHADGGFTLTSGDPADMWIDRIFAYRAGNGQLLLLAINNHGELAFGTRQFDLPLPTVGDTATNVTVLADRNMAAGDAVQSHTNTIVSVDSDAGTLVRSSAITGSTVTHPQTLRYNQARTGYLQRVAAMAPGSDGSTWQVRAFEGLPMIGMGMTVLYLPNTLGGGSDNQRFAISVRQ